ncbi:MAG: HAD-IA family hydrolase [Planctomycetota bacterium]|nr:HAD-IA family hydrolase [Planctomycetota bacterium]
MSYQMVLWDFDGTLADTWACGLRVINEIALRHNLPQITDVSAARRLTTREFLGKLGISWFKLPMIVREWHAGMKSQMDSVEFYPGIVEVLRSLRDQQRVVGILSSNSVENIQIFLRHHQAQDLFQFVESSPRLFGKARAIRRIVKRVSLKESAVLYVGDEVRDVQAAAKAGVDCAAVSWGLHEPAFLIQHSPTHLVDRADQIPLLAPSPRT